MGRVEVRDNPMRSRYELLLNGARVGMLVYRPGPDSVVFVHAEVTPRLEGRGLGGRLVSEALADVRARGLRVVPVCPFVRSYIDQHPEWRDLVVGAADLNRTPTCGS